MTCQSFGRMEQDLNLIPGETNRVSLASTITTQTLIGTYLRLTTQVRQDARQCVMSAQFWYLTCQKRPYGGGAIGTRGTGSLTPPPQQQRNRQDMWEEYKVLEARLHSDSNVAYAILGSFLAGSFVLLSVAISTLIDAAESQTLSFASLAVATVTGLFASALVYLGIRIFTRFNETGDIRRSRAVRLEKDLQISSFRMFPPWVEVDPADYLALGEIATNVGWNGCPETRRAFEVMGIQEYWRIQNSRKTRVLVYWLCLAAFVVFAFLTGIVIGIVSTM